MMLRDGRPFQIPVALAASMPVRWFRGTGAPRPRAAADDRPDHPMGARGRRGGPWPHSRRKGRASGRMAFQGAFLSGPGAAGVAGRRGVAASASAHAARRAGERLASPRLSSSAAAFAPSSLKQAPSSLSIARKTIATACRKAGSAPTTTRGAAVMDHRPKPMYASPKWMRNEKCPTSRARGIADRLPFMFSSAWRLVFAGRNPKFRNGSASSDE